MYSKLALMTLVTFFIMLALMYAMVDKYSNMYLNINQIYMTLLMSTTMVATELLVMGSMYDDSRMNFIILSACAVVFVFSLWGIRKQGLVGKKQFLKSMIVHHGAAELMAQQTLKQTNDPNIKDIAQRIISAQACEINYMKQLLQGSTNPYPCQ